MALNAHRIREQLIELKLDEPLLAERLQAQTSGLQRRRVAGLIDRVCSELSPPGRLHRIDELEVDVGSLDAEHFDTDFLQRLEPALRRGLAAAIDRLERGAVDDTPSDLRLLEIFAETGNLPWWASRASRDLIAAALARALADQPLALSELVRKLGREPRRLRRLVAELSADQFRVLAERLSPKQSQRVVQLAESLSAELGDRAEAERSSHRLRRRLAVAALSALALGKESDSGEQSVLAQFALSLGRAVLPAPTSAGGRPAPGLSERLQRWRGFGGALGQLGATLAALSRDGDGGPAELHRRIRRARSDGTLRLETLRRGVAGLLRLDLRELSACVIPGDVEALALAAMGEAGSAPKEAQRRGEVGDPGQVDEAGDPASRGDAGDVGRLREAGESRRRGEEGDWAEAPGRRGGRSDSGRLREAGESRRRGEPAGPRASVASTTRASATLANAPDRESAARDRRARLPGQLFLDDGGVVILWPFLERLFAQLELLEERRFASPASAQRGVLLLQRLACEDDGPPEYRLPLDKLLCGLEPTAPVELETELLPREVDECERVLDAAIAHASILGETSAADFRASFLQREAILAVRDGAWLLQVERRSHDLVLERFPWAWTWVRLPWMPAPLRVEW